GPTSCGVFRGAGGLPCAGRGLHHPVPEVGGVGRVVNCRPHLCTHRAQPPVPQQILVFFAGPYTSSSQIEACATPLVSQGGTLPSPFPPCASNRKQKEAILLSRRTSVHAATHNREQWYRCSGLR